MFIVVPFNNVLLVLWYTSNYMVSQNTVTYLAAVSPVSQLKYFINFMAYTVFSELILWCFNTLNVNMNKHTFRIISAKLTCSQACIFSMFILLAVSNIICMYFCKVALYKNFQLQIESCLMIYFYDIHVKTWFHKSSWTFKYYLLTIVCMFRVGREIRHRKPFSCFLNLITWVPNYVTHELVITKLLCSSSYINRV